MGPSGPLTLRAYFRPGARDLVLPYQTLFASRTRLTVLKIHLESLLSNKQRSMCVACSDHTLSSPPDAVCRIPRLARGSAWVMRLRVVSSCFGNENWSCAARYGHLPRSRGDHAAAALGAVGVRL